MHSHSNKTNKIPFFFNNDFGIKKFFSKRMYKSRAFADNKI